MFEGNAAARHLLEHVGRDRPASAHRGMLDVPGDAVVERGTTSQAVALVPVPVHFRCCTRARSMCLCRDRAISHSLERSS
jgi:hypothetical protein